MQVVLRTILILASFVATGAALAAESAPSVEAQLASARAKIAAAAAQAKTNARTAEEKAIVEADLAFAADAAKRGAEAAFGDRIHPQGKMFPARQALTVGPEAARALFKGDTSLWEWAPVEAVANGDLGVTWGIAAISGKGDDGKPFVVTTRYTTVWRRDDKGMWKIWIDIGTPGPLP